MDDTIGRRPDHRCLYDTAASQHGYVSAGEARVCGFSSDLLGHHVARGRLLRIVPGLYRLRDFPSGPSDHSAEAWMRTGKVGVISHESAMDLLDIGEIIPQAVHLIVPRGGRGRRTIPGIVLHTTTRPLAAHEITEREGLPVTSPLRTILDAAVARVSPDQVERAVLDVLTRGWVEAEQLVAAARERGPGVARFIAGALAGAER